MALKRKNWVQPSDVARYFHVNASTVSRWVSDGKLRATHLPTGHVRILARDVMKHLMEEGRSIPEELGDLGSKHVLIVDSDRGCAESMAAALRAAGGCRVTVAATPWEARGLLGGSRPDLVVLGVRRVGANGNGSSGMLILGAGPHEHHGNGSDKPEFALQVNEILSIPVDERALVSRAAHLLLG